jgi:hypothetical protein
MRSRKMLAQFLRSLDEKLVDKELSYRWWKFGHINGETERTVVADEDQALSTDCLKKRILKEEIGVLGFDSQRGLGIFLFTTGSRTALGPTQPPIQWVTGALSLWVKRWGREADHSPPSSAEVKNGWSYTSTLPIRFQGVVLS